MNRIDLDFARKHFDYNPETGELTRKTTTQWWKRGAKGSSLNKRNGYEYTTINKVKFPTSRVCWALHYGVNASKMIDHINGIRDDNRVSNLREVTCQQNLMNSKVRSHNKLGIKGIRACNDRFESRITMDKKEIYLGRFDTLEEAVSSRSAAELHYFGEYSRINGV